MEEEKPDFLYKIIETLLPTACYNDQTKKGKLLELYDCHILELMFSGGQKKVPKGEAGKNVTYLVLRTVGQKSSSHQMRTKQQHTTTTKIMKCNLTTQMK